MAADPPYVFGLGPKSEHTLEAGDGHGGKFTVKNSSDSVLVVSVGSPDATTLEVEIVEATHVSKMPKLCDLPGIKIDKQVLDRARFFAGEQEVFPAGGVRRVAGQQRGAGGGGSAGDGSSGASGGNGFPAGVSGGGGGGSTQGTELYSGSKKNHDPTQNDMLCLLLGEQITEHDSFHCGPEKMKPAIIAIYWYAVLNHGGQGSNLYTAMCQSDYKPKLTGKLESEGPVVASMYKQLCREYD